MSVEEALVELVDMLDAEGGYQMAAVATAIFDLRARVLSLERTVDESP